MYMEYMVYIWFIYEKYGFYMIYILCTWNIWFIYGLYVIYTLNSPFICSKPTESLLVTIYSIVYWKFESSSLGTTRILFTSQEYGDFPGKT